MGHLGPLISRSLIQNVGGNASRSELDKLSDPLKKLVAQHVRARVWLEQALADPSFPSSRVTAQEKAIFLKKIIRYVCPLFCFLQSHPRCCVCRLTSGPLTVFVF